MDYPLCIAYLSVSMVYQLQSQALRTLPTAPVFAAVAEVFQPVTFCSDMALAIAYAAVTYFHGIALALYLARTEKQIFKGVEPDKPAILWDDAHVQKATLSWLKKKKCVLI